MAVTSSSHPHPPPIFDFPIPIPPSSPQPKSPVICRPSLPPCLHASPISLIALSAIYLPPIWALKLQACETL